MFRSATVPLPRVEECFHAMNGGKHFTEIDVAQACHQVTLEEESKELNTINTHKGLYRWTRLPYGVPPVQHLSRNHGQGPTRITSTSVAP
uniref:Reverse transcriptase domain-containing protein n=1 Tax=Amphimedon queenslandica TaxID=400682 RepID=A0A1X7VQL6_AMPQE